MSSGHRGLCKECWNRHQRDYRAKRKSEGRDVNRAADLRRYGLTIPQYNELLAAQGGVCAICKAAAAHTMSDGRAAHLAVDHDHNTGKVRGLLCTNCNQAIGKLKHNTATSNAATAYLQKHEGSAITTTADPTCNSSD